MLCFLSYSCRVLFSCTFLVTSIKKGTFKELFEKKGTPLLWRTLSQKQNFACNYFIFLKILFHFKNLLWTVGLMCQTTQMFIFILSVSVGILVEGVFFPVNILKSCTQICMMRYLFLQIVSIKWEQKRSVYDTYSFVPNCRWVKLQILGKNLSRSFNYYKRMT